MVDFEDVPHGMGMLMRHEAKGRLVAKVADEA